MLDRIRTKFVYKTLDAVLTASLRSRKRPADYLKRIVRPGSSRYDRVAALVGLAETLLPGTERRAARFLMRPDRLPFLASSVGLLGRGSGSTVYLMEIAGAAVVLKAYRRTIGRRRAGLLELAGEFRRKFDIVSAWFAGEQEVVLPATFLILHGPLLGRPAVACVQPYLEGEKRDFFRDFRDEELIRHLHDSPILREQFILFAGRTIRRYEERGQCVDLLGAENLLVVGHGDSMQLKLIDYGILDLEVLKNEEILTCLAGRISRLQSLLDSVARRGSFPREQRS